MSDVEAIKAVIELSAAAGAGAAAAKPTAEVIKEVLLPPAKAVGDSLGVIAKGALAPFVVPFWTVDRVCSWIKERIEERLESVPSDRRQAPSLLVAGPAIEALRFVGPQGDEVLHDLYLNLLATAMDRCSAERAHPSFVELLKQLSPDEGRILGLLANVQAWGTLTIVSSQSIVPDSPQNIQLWRHTLVADRAQCEHRHLAGSYLTNLERLGLVEFREDLRLADAQDQYATLDKHPESIEAVKAIADAHRVERRLYGLMRATQYGIHFLSACVKPDLPLDGFST